MTTDLPATGAKEIGKTKVTLTGAQETLMVTLCCRMEDAKKPKPILGDKWAGYVCDQLEYDFSKLKLIPAMYASMALRARHFDQWTAEFLASHPQATVLHLACGLDSRSHRVKWAHGVRWIDVDLPDVVDLRKRLLPNPEGDYQLIAASVTDDKWLGRIPTDRPTAIVFEGLTMYLTPEEGRSLIERVTTRFPTGQLLFDCAGWSVVKLQRFMVCLRSTGAELKWAIDDPGTLEGFHEGLKLRDSLLMVDMPGVEEFPLEGRILMWILARLPYFRQMGQFLRYDF
jgi:O-methyltransferase involved in polyketide biosynthesis